MELRRLDARKAGRGRPGGNGPVDAAHLNILNRVCAHNLRANVLDIMRGEVEADEEGFGRDGRLPHLYDHLELIALKMEAEEEVPQRRIGQIAQPLSAITPVSYTHLTLPTTPYV